MTTRIHLIANSHIDPVWLWDQYEGIDEVLNTFRSACDRLDEYPDLCFTASSLQFYKWVLRYDEVLFARIREYVAGGRWEVAGGWWVEPDTNLPTEESFRKHRELSQAFADQHLGGVAVDVAYVPDSFGHPATLPKLLQETGFKYLIFCRPGAHEKPDLPGNLFWWEYEGHRVLAYRVKHHYLQPVPDGGERDEELRRRLADEEYGPGTVNAFFFGVGDHGGGPTKREIDFYRQYMEEPAAADVAFSTCRSFFQEAESLPDIPTYGGDLHMHAVGCYSVVRDLKEGTRQAERGLAFAARARDLAAAAAGPSVKAGTIPAESIDADLSLLWERTLFNQFHDILPGSCSPAAADMARAELGGVESGWRDAAYEACKKVAAARPVVTAEGEFRIFNTLDRPLRGPLQIESFQYFREGAAFCDETGREVAIQEVLPSVRCNNRRWEFVDELPARGFRSYYFDNDRPAQLSSAGTPHYAAGDRAGSRVRVDGSGICDDSGAPLMAAPRLLVLDDASDTWGHGVRTYDDVTGAFELVDTAVVHGPVVERLVQRFTYNRSAAEIVWSVYTGLKAVYADVTVNWAEDRKILKWELTPSGCGAAAYEMEGPGGGIRRDRNGEEMPLHCWVQLGGNAQVQGDRASGDRAFALLQDGAFACDCAGERLRVNLVRSNLYGFHDPVELVPEDPQHLTDQGLHPFRFCFEFGAARSAGELTRAAQEFLEPRWVIREGAGSRAS